MERTGFQSLWVVLISFSPLGGCHACAIFLISYKMVMMKQEMFYFMFVTLIFIMFCVCVCVCFLVCVFSLFSVFAQKLQFCSLLQNINFYQMYQPSLQSGHFVNECMFTKRGRVC